jgi:hypothetical protein
MSNYSPAEKIVEIDVKINDDEIVIDNGVQYITLTMDDFKKVQQAVDEKRHADRTEENLKKNWNFLGGL